tara:strand:- start:3244 stop:3594 length:351 start_codon:yes stop_codon:yes gene_type:complete
MSKISTYSNSSPVVLTDKLIGTNTAGTPANATKNFLVSDLQTLIQGNTNLQTVLDAGNTATKDVTLTGTFQSTALKGNTLQLLTLGTFADNAAAVAGGLSVNTVYKTAAGELRIVV